MKEERQRLRLFVCMKTRTDGRSCCAHQGASIVLDELQRQIMQRGETCSHIDVRPSCCLDRCEDGPVVLAFYGQLAEEATPGRELIKASLDDAAYTFTAVSARDISEIRDTVLEGRTCRTGIDVIEDSRREQRRLRCGSSR
jgi:(2Fe-2S) ferredoxin